MPWGSSGLDFALSLPKPGFYPWSGNQDHGKLHGVAKTKLTNFEKKNPWFCRECQGRSSGTARHSCSNLQEDHREQAVLGPAPGLTHMGASRAENSAHRACRGGVTPWASPSLLSQAPRAPKHEPQGLLKHLSHQNLLTSILPFRKRKSVIKPPKCRKETFPWENESF